MMPVDLRSAAPVSTGGWRYAAACNRPALRVAPPNAVVMRKVRGKWTVRGWPYPDMEAAQEAMDRIAGREGRPVWIET